MIVVPHWRFSSSPCYVVEVSNVVTQDFFILTYYNDASRLDTVKVNSTTFLENFAKLKIK
jgi:hypothetical protein